MIPLDKAALAFGHKIKKGLDELLTQRMAMKAARISKWLRGIGIAAALSISVAIASAPAQTAVPPAAPASSVAIPTAEVITKSTELDTLLAALTHKFAPSDEIRDIKRSLLGLSQQIDLDFTDTSAILGNQPPLETLKVQHALWQRWHQQISAGLTLLAQRAAVLREALGRLASLRETWILTRDNALTQGAPASIRQRIETSLAAIEAVQSQLKIQEEEALGLQGELARELARCDETLAQVSKAQESVVEGIFARENPSIWSTDLWDHAVSALPRSMPVISRGFRLNIQKYLQDPSRGMPLHATLFALLTAVACIIRHKYRRLMPSGISETSAANVFDRPFSAALMIALLVATGDISQTPERAKDVLLALVLVPTYRLTYPAIDPRLSRAVFAAVILYLCDLVRQSLGGALLVEQAMLMLEGLAAIAVLGWLLDAERLRIVTGPSPESFRARSAPHLVKGLICFLLAGFLTATFGYTRLARLITPFVLYGSILALSLYAFVRIINGAVAVVLRSWPLRKLNMVANHCARMENLVSRVLTWLAAAMWANRLLAYIGLSDHAISLGKAILDFKLERGSISVSVEDILALGLSVWAAFLLSAFIRFALQEEVYPRRGIAHGLSYAYSRLIHYIILTLGFLVGLGVLGMDLTKVTVLAGALGVGIGFGLQEVVNNFVCGLILLFERPVHAGDIVEVGGLQGEVRRIGIRGSTIRTYQGADLVVPNSQFITATVINWTLNDPLRRIDLPVVVNCTVAPEKVIDLLESTARANPRILRDPAPECLFVGYEESSVSFELWAWTNQFNNWQAIRCELLTAVYNAVQTLQREVRALGEPETGPHGISQTKKGTG
jgi:potassium-dependent mechanosensitive channel